jgi:hypothetical protein
MPPVNASRCISRVEGDLSLPTHRNHCVALNNVSSVVFNAFNTATTFQFLQDSLSQRIKHALSNNELSAFAAASVATVALKTCCMTTSITASDLGKTTSEGTRERSIVPVVCCDPIATLSTPVFTEMTNMIKTQSEPIHDNNSFLPAAIRSGARARRPRAFEIHKNQF